MSRLLNPQQEQFLKNYLDPQSETWSNATQSALKAGYKEDYAKQITGQLPKWLEEALQDSELLTKALNNLLEFLSDRDTKNIQWDASKFVLERLGKKKFSSKGEDAAEKLAENITGMRIIDGSRLSEQQPKADSSG